MLSRRFSHSTPAAVVMTMLRMLLRGRRTRPPHRWSSPCSTGNCRSAARTVCTACYATLDGQRGGSRTPSGHNPPLVVRAHTGAIEEFENPNGPPLGILDAPPYDHCCTRLEPGDSVLFYTDGLTEALNPRSDMLGLERVKEVLAVHRAESPEALRTRNEEASPRGGPAGVG
jgi:sigma-B regulation protein RsbU (phosphoserine phosphatase)